MIRETTTRPGDVAAWSRAQELAATELRRQRSGMRLSMLAISAEEREAVALAIDRLIERLAAGEVPR